MCLHECIIIVSGNVSYFRLTKTTGASVVIDTKDEQKLCIERASPEGGSTTTKPQVPGRPRMPDDQAMRRFFWSH